MRRRMMMNNARLPSEYQEVEYIESADRYCCINTEIIPSQTFEYDFVFYNGELYESNVYILGTAAASSRPRLNLGLHASGIDYTYFCVFNNESGGNTSTNFGNNIASLRVKHRLKTSGNILAHTVLCDIDGHKIGNIYKPNLPYNVPLRFFNYVNDINAGAAQMRVYYFSLKNDGALVREMIPCYRKSDNVAGMYDLCGSTCSLTNSPFYVNANTGVLIAGGNV